MRVFEELFPTALPDLLAVCEITPKAAGDLGESLKNDYIARTATPFSDNAFQVAVLHRNVPEFEVQFPIVPPKMSSKTRPMIPIHYHSAAHVIRFVACHWTSFEEEESQEAREDLAAHLRLDTYDFLKGEGNEPVENRHIVVLGDLNEEPMAKVFRRRLSAARDRASSQRKEDRRSAKRSKVWLYNAAWRFVGEQTPYGGGDVTQGIAGTFYNKKAKLGWRTFDHILVSGGLLKPPAPYLDEARTKVVFTEAMKGANGLPCPFEMGNGLGASDHLPIVGRIILSEAKS